MSWTKSQAAKILPMLDALAMAKGKELGEPAYMGYEMGLEGLSVQQIEHAVKRSLKESKHMPSPAELRELAGDVSTSERAIAAFTALDQACAALGAYRSVDFDDPIINAAVRSLGGWEYVCYLGKEEFHKWFRKDFLRTYESFARSGVNGDVCRSLPGICEQSNSVKGYLTKTETYRTGLPWVEEHRKKIGLPEQKTLDGPAPRGIGNEHLH